MLLQLFWLSLVVIGIAEFILHDKLSRTKRSPLGIFLSQTHVLVRLVFAFAAGMASFALVVLPACFFELPVAFIIVSYALILIASISFVIREWELVKTWLGKVTLSKRSSLLLLIIGGILIADFILALHTGGQVEGDAKFEIAQINLFAYKHLTLADPIFGKNGAPVAIYSTSIQHALQAVAVRILNVSAPWVWVYSYAFFRLAIWLSLFALAWEYLDKKVRGYWSYAVLAIVPFLFGAKFSDAELHNVIIFAWFALFIIAIKLWVEKKGQLLLLVSSILIATTHPLSAFMAACFLGLNAGVLAALRFIPLRQVKGIVPIIVMLLLPMVLFLYYPHGITNAGFSDNASSGPMLHLLRHGFLIVSSPHFNFRLPELGILVLIASLLAAATHISSAKIRITLLLLIALLAVLIYNPVLLGLIGSVYILIKTPNKATKVILALLFIFLSLVIYNPVVMSVIGDQIPLWAISRFNDLNVVALITPIIGLLCLTAFPALAWGYKKLAIGITIGIVISYVTLIPFVSPANSIVLLGSTGKLVSSNGKKNLKTLEDLVVFNPSLRGQIVFSDDRDLPAKIPGVIVTNVFSIDNQANANGAVHIRQRIQCAEQLRQNLRSIDIQESGITRIITDSQQGSHFDQLLRNRSDIVLLQQTHGYRVYQVKENIGIPADFQSICNIPPTNL